MTSKLDTQMMSSTDAIVILISIVLSVVSITYFSILIITFEEQPLSPEAQCMEDFSPQNDCWRYVKSIPAENVKSVTLIVSEGTIPGFSSLEKCQKAAVRLAKEVRGTRLRGKLCLEVN
ncbi:hypothetical protein ACQU0X_25665 [Pseudovibrio ascidiaceicola]|uniref:hypothetical protein n=1 Tax=Pseudovibrio ascidiaceicola TaxID=285279 RepID=UPI003D3664FD